MGNPVFISDEDSDSYITLSDSSEIMSTEVGAQSQQETYQLSYKPILMEVYQNNHRNISHGNEPTRSFENKTKRNFMEMKSLNHESFTAIGSPESLNVPQKSRINVLQKSVRLFKRSKVEWMLGFSGFNPIHSGTPCFFPFIHGLLSL